MAKVLVADDTPAMLELITDTLELLGHEVVSAVDGAKALKLLGLRPDGEPTPETDDLDWKRVEGEWTTDKARLPQLILTDVQMPLVDGYALCNTLLANRMLRQIPVIVLTSKAKMDQPFRELANVAAFLVKPPKTQELAAAVQGALARAGAQ